MINYLNASLHASQSITKQYSTSFYTASLFYPKKIRDAIFGIYGFVRIADEIVDSFHQADQEMLLNKFEKDFYDSIINRISTNPILHSFQQIVHQYNIPMEYIQAFLKSMREDLKKKEYTTKEELDEYIYGSASVVGLMCLCVFCQGDLNKVNQLSEPAKKLGEAFQKVNFLRDLNEDVNNLNRVYFYQIENKLFNEEVKQSIVSDIEKDFTQAYQGIKDLPNNSKIAVYIAYIYYLKLLKKIKNTKAENILSKRYRISNFRKSLLIFKALVLCKLKIV